ncbi:MAG: ATP-binding cassette domain-containing protein [Peptococcaceae bacterium]|nr:ATP-binding cassette domain-containing protein [Peptococcaceae bacterium]
MTLLQVEDLYYAYDKKKPLLKGVNLQLSSGQLACILGPSGSGKTTLLSLLGGLDSPDAGRILFEGENIADALAAHRRDHVSFIFQSYNLIDYLTPIENVALTARQSPLEMLERVGLHSDEMHRHIGKLSGGQQQRVAIARALASNAPLILADEPTGNLDADNAQRIIDLLLESAHEMKRAVVVVTHALAFAERADCTWRLKRGVLVED